VKKNLIYAATHIARGVLVLESGGISLFYDLEIEERRISMASKVSQEYVRTNYLLASLKDDDLERMIPKLSIVEFELGAVLYEAGEKMDHAYFPTTAIVSLLYIMESGSTAEIGVIGNDGIVGLSLLLGGETTTNRAVVQSAGSALRIKAADLKAEFQLGTELHDLMLRYTQALMTQISQTAVCNRLHPIEEQLCRWLLLSHDRLHSDKLVMTHDLISNMLGVRREGITLAAQKLAKRKLITNRRGTMTVIDRRGLEDAACECYEVVKTEYDRILGWRASRADA
jgi:CRP-like cAMP-binding protein